MIFRFIIFFFIHLIFINNLNAESRFIRSKSAHPVSFLIVVDDVTFDKTSEAVFAYRDATEKQGLSAHILVDRWASPADLKKQIKELYQHDDNLEGLVLIGDIPVAMVRDAQHLTTAFKIDQERFSLPKTSVPSDRYYDDFDLIFNDLGPDTSNQLLHYYALSADSPQKIESDVYSARIKAPVDDNTKYDLINAYLRRIAANKSEENKLDQAFVFTGHGYHSESLDAWQSAIMRYREQFPVMFTSSGRMKTYYHEMDPGLKPIVLSELQNPDLDMAIFHAHGATDRQYLLGFEAASSISQNVESIKLFLRSKMRQAKRRKRSVAEAKLGYMERYNVPLAWFEGAFDDSLIYLDSLLYAGQDIHPEDIRKIETQAQLIYFDECFNGAFIRTPYIAGEYLFNEGRVQAAIANSVNVKQDIWADEYLGLLNYGMRLGNWLLLQNKLELHIFGDPTFHFRNTGQHDLNLMLRGLDPEKNRWREWLNHEAVPLRVLALNRFFNNNGQQAEQKLLQLYRDDPSLNVRLQALKYLAALQTESFENLLFETANDPGEFIRRMTVIWMGEIGKEDYFPVLADLSINDPSERVRFNAKNALEQIGPQKALPFCLEEIDRLPDGQYKDMMEKRMRRSLRHSQNWLEKDLLGKVASDTAKLKARLSAVRTFRNYHFHEAVPELIKIALDKQSEETLRISIFEALGWFAMSKHRDRIAQACRTVIRDSDSSDEIKKAAKITEKRLLQGLNNTVTP